MNHRCKVAVLMGGVSNERDVSFKSGKAVAEALREAGHEVAPVDVHERTLDMLDAIRPDVAFVALHGAWGEDGQVQAMLQQKAIPYTGSGPEASLCGIDKVQTKRAFIRSSVPTADYFVVERGEEPQRAADEADVLSFPLVCKPACGGSSLGVTIVRSADQLAAALQAALAEQDEMHALVERYVLGREFTVGVLDGEALPVVEICPKREFFDYEAKYTDEDTEYIIPVSLLPSTYRKMQDAAVRAYEALGCRHFARVDVMSGFDGKLYVLETNTIPGFTPRSLLPMAARHAGIEFPALCDRLVQMALRTHEAEASVPDKHKRRTA